MCPPIDPHGVPGPMSPTRESAMLGDEDEEEEDDEFGGQETLVTARPPKAEAEFSQQDTLVIREDQPRVSCGHSSKCNGRCRVNSVCS